MKKVRIMEKVGFSTFIGGEKLLYLLVTVYATIYYVSELGINPGIVALLVFGTRMFDAVNDPIIGSLIDKGKTKYKTYVNITAILLPISTFLIFMNPFESGILALIYCAVTYVGWSVLYTISEVPIYSIVSRMTSSKREQEKIFSIAPIGEMTGIWVGMLLMAFYMRNGVESINWVLMASTISVLGLFQMLMTVLFVKENVSLPKKNSHLKITTILKQTFKNKHLLTIMVIYTAQMFVNASTVLGAYVWDGYYHKPSLGTMISLVGMLVIIPLALTMAKLIRRYGKTNLIYLAVLCMFIPNLVILITGVEGSAIIMLLIISQIGVVIPSILRPLYTQECINYAIKTQGHTNEAAAFSLMTFFNKTGDALGATLGSLLLVFVGFDESLELSQQAPHVIDKMHVLYFLGPIFMASMWFIGIRYFYKLSNPKKIEIPISEETFQNDQTIQEVA